MRSSLIFFLLVPLVSSASIYNCHERKECTICTQDPLCQWSPTEGCVFENKKIVNETTILDSYKCPVQPSVEYDETMARYTLWTLIGATKANTTSIEFQSCKSRVACDTFHIKRINVTCNSKREYCSADVYVIPSRKQIISLIHGSTGMPQILHLGLELELTAVATQMPNFKGLVLAYFAESHESLWNGGLKDVLNWTLSKYPGFEVWCTGHSLGGPVAALMAAQLAHDHMVSSDKLRLVTFGGPRLGTEDFNRELVKNVPYHFRVINQYDPVVTMPKKFAGTDIKLEHFRYEVWYPSGMNKDSLYQTCLVPEDPNCRADKPPKTTTDHVTYFGVEVDKWWMTGCEY